MPLPYMKTEARRSQKQIISFYGINYSQNVKDGELSESEGLSSAQFPSLNGRGEKSMVPIKTRPDFMPGGNFAS